MPTALVLDRVVLGIVPVDWVDLPSLVLGGRGGGRVDEAYQGP